MASKSNAKGKLQHARVKPSPADTAPFHHEAEGNFLIGLYDEQLKKSAAEIEDLNNKIQRLSTENLYLKKELDKAKDYKPQTYETKVEDLEGKVTELQRQLTLAKEAQKERLGQPADANLRQKNSVTESKGKIRIKFAEKFSQLYNDLWKDALKEQIDNEGKSEEDGISFLLTIIKDANVFSSTQSTQLQNPLSPLKQGHGMPDEKNMPPVVAQKMKEINKNISTFISNTFKEEFVGFFIEKFFNNQKTSGKTFGKATTKYAAACAFFCWFMCFEDPPLYMDVNIPNGDFDTEKYRAYTETGTKYRYLVWPCLYLHKEGPMLEKGIAQGK